MNEFKEFESLRLDKKQEYIERYSLSELAEKFEMDMERANILQSAIKAGIDLMSFETFIALKIDCKCWLLSKYLTIFTEKGLLEFWDMDAMDINSYLDILKTSSQTSILLLLLENNTQELKSQDKKCKSTTHHNFSGSADEFTSFLHDILDSIKETMEYDVTVEVKAQSK